MKELEKKISKSVKRNPKDCWSYVNSKMKHRETILNKNDNTDVKSNMDKFRSFKSDFSRGFSLGKISIINVHTQITQWNMS